MKELINNFAKQHNYFKTVTLVSIISLVITIIISVFLNYKLTKEKYEQTYIVIEGRAYKAVSVDNYSYPERKYEILQAVKEFYMHRYCGDRYSYEDNIKIALEYCGYSSERVLTEYQEEQMSRLIKERGYSYVAYLDSIVLINDFEGFAFGRQAVRTKSQETLRNIWIRFEARNISRSDKNMLGVVFDEIELYNNKVIDIINN